jgi:hypothetical protein
MAPVLTYLLLASLLPLYSIVVATRVNERLAGGSICT